MANLKKRPDAPGVKHYAEQAKEVIVKYPDLWFSDLEFSKPKSYPQWEETREAMQEMSRALHARGGSKSDWRNLRRAMLCIDEWARGTWQPDTAAERRTWPGDDTSYTLQEFVSYYGPVEAHVRWDDMSAMQEQMHPDDPDQEMHTLTEFHELWPADFYTKWQEASKERRHDTVADESRTYAQFVEAYGKGDGPTSGRTRWNKSVNRNAY
ncbi:hypothetical protein DIPPA_13400 [Diplonema papillatum]|nr:hypothetical protein DIPPA_13400 [Diplonema papillatum]